VGENEKSQLPDRRFPPPKKVIAVISTGPENRFELYTCWYSYGTAPAL
jgi:hypothetical protein